MAPYTGWSFLSMVSILIIPATKPLPRIKLFSDEVPVGLPVTGSMSSGAALAFFITSAFFLYNWAHAG